MQFKRIVDLSHTFVLEEGDRPIHAEMVPPPEFDDFPADQWYIMHKVSFLNHTGTHIETPYHVVEDGNDLASVPLEQLCGPAIILDLTHVKPGGAITASMIEQAAEKAGGMQSEDIVFCRFDRDRYMDDPDEPEIPRFTPESLEWLVEHGMKLMGVDSGGIELSRKDPRALKQHNHHLILDRGIPLIENLANLSRLNSSRVTVFAFPIAVQKLDSFPLRVVAVEEA